MTASARIAEELLITPSLSEGVMYEDQGNFPDEIEGSDLLAQAQSTATALRTLRTEMNERIQL